MVLDSGSGSSEDNVIGMEVILYCGGRRGGGSGGVLTNDNNAIDPICQGDVIPTAGGGAAVVFNDVEELKQTSPGSRKRRSNSSPADVPDDWTDTETRCQIGVEGHAK